MAFAVKDAGHTGSIYAALLLREAQKHIQEMAQKKRLIKAIYATSRTREGIYLAQRMQMDIIPEWRTDHLKAFVLDLGKSTTKYADEYRQYIRTLDLPKSLTQGILKENVTFPGKPQRAKVAKQASATTPKTNSRLDSEKTEAKPTV